MKLRILAIVPAVAALALLGVASPAVACACGGIAPQPGDTVAVDQERAIVSMQGGQEQLDLRLGFDSLTKDTGLIFPTPGPAKVTAGQISDFDAIETAIAPRVVQDDDWWGGLGLAGAGAPEAGGAPQVLDEVQLGPLTATTLAASDSAGLTEWLTTNGYAIPDAVNALLGDYVTRGWYFVALKLTSDTPLEGGLDPITFTFPSEKLVYPMDLSKAASNLQQVRLYVLSDHRAVAEELETSAPYDSASTTWAGAAPSEFGDRGSYLTVLDLYLYDPAHQATDLAFVADSTDEKIEQVVHETHVVTFLGIPAGWAIVMGVVLLGFGMFAALVIVLVRVATRPRAAPPQA